MRSEGIHSSVVFHLAGSKGHAVAAEEQWRLEELATDQKFICLRSGSAPNTVKTKGSAVPQQTC